MSDKHKSVSDYLQQLKDIAENGEMSDTRRVQAIKILLKQPETKEFAIEKLESYAEDDVPFAIELLLNMERKKSTKMGGVGINVGEYSA